MAEPSSIARPYAEAVFRLADAGGKLAEWSASLANLTQVAADERVRRAIGDPRLPTSAVAGMILAVLSGRLSGDAENFVRVLAENRRLGVLGEIHAQFEALLARVHARMTAVDPAEIEAEITAAHSETRAERHARHRPA